MWAAHRTFVTVVLVTAASIGAAGPARGWSTSSQWRWRNPSPQGNNVGDIACPTSTMCMTNGAITGASISHDAGSSWTVSPVGTADNPADIFACPSARVCFAGAFYGALFRTVDSGASWSPLKSHLRHLTTSSFKAISCPSITTCYLIGSKGTFVTTGDGGDTWAARGVVASGLIDALACPDEQTCYVASSAGVIKTVDGGVTWNPVYTGPQTGSAISCPTVSVCYEAGAPVLATVDGGNIWTPRSIPVAGASGGNAIHCSDSTHCVELDSDNDIVSTADGVTWNVTLAATAVTDFDTHVTDFGCVPSSALCLAGGTSGLMFRSVDAGETWNEIDHTVTRNGLDAISCQGKTFCVAVGGSTASTALVTTDGGTNWSWRPQAVDDWFVAVSCASTTVCVAVGLDGNAIATTDAGVTWSEQRVANDLSAVSCPSASTCYASTRSGAILVTNDGADTWRPISNLPSLSYSMSCPTTRTCFVTGSNQTGTAMSKSVDGARTWTTTTISAPSIAAISCSSVMHCAAVGLCQQVRGACTGAVTYDGGQTWGGSTYFDASLNSVSCTSATFCVAVGEYGQGANPGDIQVSTNGGGLWTDVSPLAWGRLFGVSCDHTKCWAVGDNGAILTN